MKLTLAIYAATRAFPREEIYGLTSQLRRAAVSIPSNVAEGHSRLSDDGFSVFLGHSRGSLAEVVTQLELSKDLGYISAVDCDLILDSCTEVAKLINGLLRSLRAAATK